VLATERCPAGGEPVRAFIQRSLACAIGGFAVGLSSVVLAQAPAEELEEIIVRAKPLNQYRVEVELARDEMIRVFNEANEGEDNDVRCRMRLRPPVTSRSACAFLLPKTE
jgi:hypothetical protein